MRISIGRLAYQRGFLDEHQVLAILQAQTERNLRFGELAIELGFLSPERRDELVRLQEQATPPLGQVIAELYLVPPDVLAKALDEYAARVRG